MKLRILIIAFLVAFAALSASAQEELPIVRKIYHASDSMVKSGAAGAIETHTVTAAGSLDKLPPIAYFNEATDMIQAGKFNDAAFIYYLGTMRYQYYSSSNPGSQSSDEGHMYANVQSELVEPLGLYLRSNADNYIKILTAVADYYIRHDYTFYPSAKDRIKYVFQAERMNDFIADLKKHQPDYEQKWLAERKEIEQMILSDNKH